MDYNPYTAPIADNFVSHAAVGGGAAQPWEVGEVIGLGWEAVKRDWPVLVFAPFLAQILSSIPNIAFTALEMSGVIVQLTPEWWAAYAATLLTSLIIGSFFWVGLLRIFVAAARGQEPEFAWLFGGADRFVALCGTNVLFVLAFFVSYLCLIVPGIIVLAGLFLSPFYCVDASMGPIAALRASWTATTGHKWQMFLLGLAAFGLSVLGLLACGVGVFVAMPVTYVAAAVVYLRLSGQTAAAAPQGPAGFGPPPGMPPRPRGFG